MAIRIEKNAPATLSAQAVAGGSLLADTTYYVTVVFSRTSNFREGTACGHLSNEVEVLTTSVNKSIQLNYSWSVDIVSFADYSGGTELKITTDGPHYLLHQDNITISGTTNYDGTYAVRYDVTDIDGIDAPNEFRILATWAGDDATGTVTDDTDDQIGSNFYWAVRCSISQAYVGGEWSWSIIDGNDWIGGRGYGLIGAVQDYTITTKPLIDGNGVVDYLPYFKQNSSRKGITNHDRPYIQISGSETWDDIVNAMVAWLPNNTNYWNVVAVASKTHGLYFQGHLEFVSLDTVITVQNWEFTMDGSMETNSWTRTADYLKFNYCDYRQLGCRRPQICGTFYYSSLRDECTDSPYMDKAVMENSSYLPSSNITFYGTESAVWDGGSITFNNVVRYLWFVYPQKETPQTRMKNIIINIGYLYIYAPINDHSIVDDTHFLENMTINSLSTTIDMYFYVPNVSCQKTWEYLNVRAPNQTNGIVRCRRSNLLYSTSKFFFSVDIKVVDENGDPIVGATVTMTDTLSTEVTDDTDANGEVSINVLSYLNEPGVDVYGDVVNYNPFVLTVEAAGYATYTENAMDFYNKIDKIVALAPPAGAIIYGSTLYGSTIQ